MYFRDNPFATLHDPIRITTIGRQQPSEKGPVTRGQLSYLGFSQKETPKSISEFINYRHICEIRFKSSMRERAWSDFSGYCILSSQFLGHGKCLTMLVK